MRRRSTTGAGTTSNTTDTTDTALPRRAGVVGVVRRRWLRATLLGLAALAVLASSDVLGGPASPGRAIAVVPISVHHAGGAKTATATGAAAFLGPDGVESEAMVRENELPGTTAWEIAGTPTGSIAGFADANYVQAGDSVGLYVSTAAASFTMTAYRMGYYRGAGARAVWSSPSVPGIVQPPCPRTVATNMVACDDWSASLRMQVTAAFTPGMYLLKLVGSDGQQGYIPLTVWDPASTATYLVVGRTLTEEGWNSYGGYDYYVGQGPCAGDVPRYPVCNRARVVSFDRPFAGGDGASDFLSSEYPLVRFMEQHGLDATYVTDVTVDEHPDITLRHKAYLSLSHDETWTTTERDAAENAVAHGVNVAFFGAAAVLRHARLQASPLGPDREEVDYRDAAEDPLDGIGDAAEITGNTFSASPTDWPETGFTGEVYSGYLAPGKTAPLVVTDAGSWLFDGTGVANGDTLAQVVGSDIDHVSAVLATPGDLQVLAHSPVPLNEATAGGPTWSADTYSDMTYFTDQGSYAGVFDAGTVHLMATLACVPVTANCPVAVARTTPLVAQMVGNLLRLFGQEPAGLLQPSVGNVSDVFPAGS